MAVWSSVQYSALPGLRLDPEYYTPQNLQFARAVDRFAGGSMSLREMCQIITDGDHLARDFRESGVLFLTSENFDEFSINYASELFLDPNYERTLARARSEPWAIYLTKTGAHYGKAAVCPPNCPTFNVSADVAKIKLKNGYDPCFVAAYLNSAIGFALVRRESTGATRDRIVLENLRSLRVPLAPNSGRFRALVEAMWSKQSASVNAMAKAEELLMACLNLGAVDLSPSRWYSRPFSELQASSRFGAEYFMPCKARTLDALSHMPSKPLERYAPAVREMWDPSRAPKHEYVRNFDVTDALEPFLGDDKEPQQAGDIGSAKKRFRAGDVVVSRLRSYLREIAIVRTSGDPPAVGSSEFIVLRPKPNGVSPETLMVYLRCPLVQTVLKWSQDGSNHPRFTEDDLLKIPVPDEVLAAQTEIDAQVNAAITARSEAAELLKATKRAVAEMIQP